MEDYLKNAKADYVAAGSYSQVEDAPEGQWAAQEAIAAALIALAETQAQALEEQRKTNEILRAALDLATKVVACSHIPSTAYPAKAALDNFTEHPRETKVCTACSGSGYYDVDGSPPCGACNGTGYD